MFAALEPDPIYQAGYVQVEASTIAADMVYMSVDGGPRSEMVQVEPDRFEAVDLGVGLICYVVEV